MMVQLCDDTDLTRRFSRIEQIRFDRRNREKVENSSPGVISLATIMNAERVRRVLFEPDTNLQHWVSAELGKISENKKARWNFDFKIGSPANIPGHVWSWERVPVPPSAPVPAAEPVAPSEPAAPVPAGGPAPVEPAAPVPVEAAPTRRRRAANGPAPTSDPADSGSADHGPTRGPKARKQSQTKITDYMGPKKNKAGKSGQGMKPTDKSMKKKAVKDIGSPVED